MMYMMYNWWCEC